MIIGHQKQWEYLKKLVELDHLPHCLLFSGQEKLGKKTIAIEFIKLLFNQNLSQARPHPDFILIEPPTKNLVGGEPHTKNLVGGEPKEKEIQISQIKELIQKLSLKPSSAPLKAAIIDKAHLMNQEAQNCFLKTLEEPKGETLLILITEYPEMLFPTILSRVQKIRFYPVKKIEIEKYLKKQEISEKKIEEITELSLGRPGIAIDFILNPQKLENQKKATEELVEILNSEAARRFQYAKNLSQSSNVKETLEIWTYFFRKILISKVKNGKEFKNYSISKLRNILQQIQKTNFLLTSTNVNPRLALEVLMLEL